MSRVRPLVLLGVCVALTVLPLVGSASRSGRVDEVAAASASGREMLLLGAAGLLLSFAVRRRDRQRARRTAPSASIARAQRVQRSASSLSVAGPLSARWQVGQSSSSDASASASTSTLSRAR